MHNNIVHNTVIITSALEFSRHLSTMFSEHFDEILISVLCQNIKMILSLMISENHGQMFNGDATMTACIHFDKNVF